MMDSHAAFAPAPDVVIRDLGGEAVILDLATGTYFGLNDSGTRMWQLIEEHRTLSVVVERLAEEFDTPIERLEMDLHALVERLVAKGLLQPLRTAGDAE